MRFPSISFLIDQAWAVLRRFPWTLAAGATAATTSIVASTSGSHDDWLRTTFVAALGLPLTVALGLLGEQREWPKGTRVLAQLAGIGALIAFWFAWPGISQDYEAIHYLQVSAAVHLSVAFLPFLGRPESGAFWQYNRRLFLGFLRAVVFSAVLFAGLAVALGALDKLFGVDVPGETYFRIWLVIAFVVNTWIFLAVVPRDFHALARDTEYPRALKIFAQFILTPLAFTYLVILLAYLVKIVLGGEWPSGWIGWLVASVSVTGILGFLLVHPLRSDPGEAWIRTYARWLFVGLMPASLMLLTAFWKRIAPYGLTEPRTLGLVLGVWLLGIAILYTVRQGAGIRIIPVSLAILLLLTVYGPASLTHLSIVSQGRRLAEMLKTPSDSGHSREASAALRFLMERRAATEIATRIGQPLPPIDWTMVAGNGEVQDSVGRRILALRSVEYVRRYDRSGAEWWVRNGTTEGVAVTGFDWVVALSSGDNTPRMVGNDSVSVVPGASPTVRIRVGSDTLAFDLRAIAAPPATVQAPPERLRVETSSQHRRGVLSLDQLTGSRSKDSMVVTYWHGMVLLGGAR
jgi:hypothetical protein